MGTCWLPSSFVLLLSLLVSSAVSEKATYIVLMSHSDKPSSFSTTQDWYTSILHSLSDSLLLSNSSSSTTPKLLYTYSHAATGFAAHMLPAHADQLRRYPSVLSIIRDKLAQAQTTRSPTFLGFSAASTGLWKLTDYGSDTIIGVVDSGITPAHASFGDAGMTNVPPSWKGICQTGPGFPATSCNKKIIGARYFSQGYEAMYGKLPPEEVKSPKDVNGHGTHVASIAGGSQVPDASFHHYAKGTAQGMVSKARISVYKVLWGNQITASDADILAGIEQAISDGVHVISMSIAGSEEYYNDPKAIASFHAMKKRIVVSTGAGNTGPSPGTVANTAPWMLTAAASSIDRTFPADLVLGNTASYRGSTLYNFDQNTTIDMPLVRGAQSGDLQCRTGNLKPPSVTGKMVICEGGAPVEEKCLEVKRAGGVGMILIDITKHGTQLIAYDCDIPSLLVTNADGAKIKEYSRTQNPTAKIQFKCTVIGPAPSAPRMAAFSSRGPNLQTPELLKPDVTAPGVNILAAWTGAFGIWYNILSGTSMACPHVSGLAAMLRKVHPTWSPAAIKSAIMTSAYNVDKAGNSLIDTSTGGPSTPFVHGSGHIDPTKVADPGLIYDLDEANYITFLCSIKYTPTQIAIFEKDPNLNKCPPVLPSPGDLNYPSFSIVFKSDTEKVTYTRKVTNVGSEVDAVYQVKISMPPNVDVKVIPEKLEFAANAPTKSYTISFTSVRGPITRPKQAFGSIEWSDSNKAHTVRSPIAASWPSAAAEEDAVASI